MTKPKPSCFIHKHFHEHNRKHHDNNVGLQRVVVNGIKSDWAPVVSGVPQGTVLGPLLFSLYINDISVDIESEIRLFADDCVCYREIKNEEDTLKLQRDIGRLGTWARKWEMGFQPVKSNMMQLTKGYPK